MICFPYYVLLTEIMTQIQMKHRMKDTSTGVPRSAYGSQPPIKEVGKKDFRRKKMFGEGD